MRAVPTLAWYLVLLYLYTYLPWLPVSGAAISGESQLYAVLTDNFSYPTPRRNTNVTASIYLSQILELDGREGVVKFLANFRLEWWDEDMKWDPMQYNVTETLIAARFVWIPDVGIWNSFGPNVKRDWREFFPVRMRHDGRFLWQYSDMFSTTCSFDMSTFPFDVQDCYVIYGNLVSTMDQVAFNERLNYFARAETYVDSEEFEVKDLSVTHKEYPRETTSALHFRMLLKRRPYYYVVNIIVPCALLACVAMLSFVMSPASGERVGLQVTVLLSLVVFQLMITGLVPVTSKNTPVMTYAICCMMIIMVLALLGNICALRYHQPHSKRMGAVSRAFILQFLGFLLCCKNIRTARRQQRKGSGSLRRGSIKPIEGDPEDANGNSERPGSDTIRSPPIDEAERKEWQKEWHTAAKILDRFFIYFFMVAIGCVIIALLAFRSEIPV